MENKTTKNYIKCRYFILNFYPPPELQIFTDSKYVKLGITEWIHNWKKNGWKTANKQKVKNKELWTELDRLSNEFDIKWGWVKAHSTDKLNNEVDLLARKAAS